MLGSSTSQPRIARLTGPQRLATSEIARGTIVAEPLRSFPRSQTSIIRVVGSPAAGPE